MYSGKNIFISRLLRPAGRNKRYFHRWGRGGKLYLCAKASPFGRGGCERSEQTERARTLTRACLSAGQQHKTSPLRGLERSPQRGCFRRKPALQMPLSSTTLPVKMQCRSVRRLPGIALIKIILPLNMARAKRKPFKIVRPALPQALRLTARRGSGCTPPWKRNGRGCARPSDGWWKGLWERTGPPTGSGGWQCRAAPASPAG